MIRPSSPAQESPTSGVLDGLVDEITARVNAGEEVDVAQYAREYPQYAERIGQILPAIHALAKLGPSLSPPTQAGVDLSDTVPAAPPTGVLGDFRLIREIGRGGMGVVYEAEQMSLGRRVALKILPLAGILDERQLTRFRNEARAAASLKHANIVGVHAVGCERGVHYYAMEYVEGKTLAEVIAELQRESGAGTGATAARSAGFSRSQPPEGGTTNEPPAAAPSLTPHTPGPEVPTEADPVGQAFQPDVGLERPTNEPRASPPQAEDPNAGDEAHVGGSLRDPQPVSERPDYVPRPAADTDRIGRAQASTQKPIGTKDFFRRVANWGIQAAEGLEHAHQTGIVHRDVKPSNLLVDTSGHLWITDFGLAQVQADAGITMTGDIRVPSGT